MFKNFLASRFQGFMESIHLDTNACKAQVCFLNSRCYFFFSTLGFPHLLCKLLDALLLPFTSCVSHANIPVVCQVSVPASVGLQCAPLCAVREPSCSLETRDQTLSILTSCDPCLPNTIPTTASATDLLFVIFAYVHFTSSFERICIFPGVSIWKACTWGKFIILPELQSSFLPKIT